MRIFRFIIISSFCFISSKIFAQNWYNNPTFTINGETYKVKALVDNQGEGIIFVENLNNKCGKFPYQRTSNYEEMATRCTALDVVDVKYLMLKIREIVNNIFSLEERIAIIQNESYFRVIPRVTYENKVEVRFEFRPNSIITPMQIYTMDMALRQIPISFNPRGYCAMIDLKCIEATGVFCPKIDE
ncbi:hypothetical protein [Raineya orbicola]|jgi:hypothetical protein|uniref:Uncharacterized protein n=1 Tax=Raineya orbicola TaxID=2016530 RepID=A0A2N3IIJ4_9BACT|nr:hypothetical protein [Raineya orbicola]PKQ70116.1 hypothetical protein Rain11_0776 [Raineya orbicola]